MSAMATREFDQRVARAGAEATCDCTAVMDALCCDFPTPQHRSDVAALRQVLCDRLMEAPDGFAIAPKLLEGLCYSVTCSTRESNGTLGPSSTGATASAAAEGNTDGREKGPEGDIMGGGCGWGATNCATGQDYEELWAVLFRFAAKLLNSPREVMVHCLRNYNIMSDAPPPPATSTLEVPPITQPQPQQPASSAIPGPPPIEPSSGLEDEHFEPFDTDSDLLDVTRWELPGPTLEQKLRHLIGSLCQQVHVRPAVWEACGMSAQVLELVTVLLTCDMQLQVLIPQLVFMLRDHMMDNEESIPSLLKAIVNTLCGSSAEILAELVQHNQTPLVMALLLSLASSKLGRSSVDAILQYLPLAGGRLDFLVSRAEGEMSAAEVGVVCEFIRSLSRQPHDLSREILQSGAFRSLLCAYIDFAHPRFHNAAQPALLDLCTISDVFKSFVLRVDELRAACSDVEFPHRHPVDACVWAALGCAPQHCLTSTTLSALTPPACIMVLELIANTHTKPDWVTAELQKYSKSLPRKLPGVAHEEGEESGTTDDEPQREKQEASTNKIHTLLKRILFASKSD
ncbi:hypothetical protein Pelo_1970 [Pelomyxa schiedti]|nr:hypothetical protein Pelo_1970 [Pelomyxa schiedti]